MVVTFHVRLIVSNVMLMAQWLRRSVPHGCSPLVMAPA